MKRYIGEYNEQGYTIYEINTEEPVYTAGNYRLDLHAIGESCEQTGKKIAEENNGKWIGSECTAEVQ